MSLFPIFLKLGKRKCVIVGGGRIGEAKAAALLDAGAAVVVVAPEVTDAIRALAREGKLIWIPRAFVTRDLDGALLAVGATNSEQVNHEVFRGCAERGVLCNVVDDPDRCDFYYPAVVKRGALQIAVSTGGHSPALARRIRKELEQQFGPEYQSWVEEVEKQRKKVLSGTLPSKERRHALEEMASREAFERFVAQARTNK